MLKGYIVSIFVSNAMLKAIETLAQEKTIHVLVSYARIKEVNGLLAWVYQLKRIKNTVVMLDSGAFDMKWYNVPVPVPEYLDFVARHKKIFDIIVAPDVLGNCKQTIKRTKEFIKHYYKIYDAKHPPQIMPVLQGPSMDEYINCYVVQEELLSEYGLKTDYWGIGGLIDGRDTPQFLIPLFKKLSRLNSKIKIHLFGVGPKLIASLGPYKKYVESFDTGWWFTYTDVPKRGKDGLKDPFDEVVKRFYKRTKDFLDLVEQIDKAEVSTLAKWLEQA